MIMSALATSQQTKMVSTKLLLMVQNLNVISENCIYSIIFCQKKLVGVMKVVGSGKVHANILRRSSTGKLETQVAGFTKLSSGNKNDLYGALLSVSESITAYIK